MYDLITVGNVTIDLFFQGKDLTQEKDRFSLAIGGKYVADYFTEEIGGSGANVAIGCTNLGLSVAPFAKVGENSFKQIILQKMLRKNVSTEFLQYDKTYTNVSTILLTPKGERTIVHYLTPNETMGASEMILKNLLKSNALYMGNLPDISLVEKGNLMKAFKEKDAFVFLNIGTRDSTRPEKEIMPYVQHADVLILNRFEFAELTKTEPEKLDLKKSQLSRLKKDNMILIITDGKAGSFGYRGNDVFFEEPLEPSTIVDTTGAGDAYCAGFITSFLENKDVKTAMRAGAEYAKKIISKIGAN